MKLQHIEIDNLNTTALNVRKKGGKEIGDLVPSIRSLGVLQPLLVRPKTDGGDRSGYEIIAGQRCYHALKELARDGEIDPAHKQAPCIIMDEQDNAKAIEASLVENIARLPMDEIDQYKAFAALIKAGNSVDDIASQFGCSERLVQQRLAIANLISPILNAYRKEEISAGTIRSLTLATKARQKQWWELFKADEYAPQGQALKEWLFGGAKIAVQNALFDLAEYKGSIISDLFGDERIFADSEKFWPLQNQVIADNKEQYLSNGWPDVVLLERGVYWSSWDYCKTTKKRGGKVFIETRNNGEVSFHEGYLDEKTAKQLENKNNGSASEKPIERSELTKPMQNYLELHRHAAVRSKLLNHAGIALRLAVAQMIAGSDHWSIHADPQKANNDAIADSLATNKAEDKFAVERQAVRDLLGGQEDESATIVPDKNDWQRHIDLPEFFAKLMKLDDEAITRILSFVVAETLSAGSVLVEILGNILSVDISESWSPDQTFLDLHRDKEAINTMLKHIGGKPVADGNISATAKVQKKIIADYLDGTRQSPTKEGGKNWQPHYMGFPMRAYTKRGGINAIDQWKSVKKHFA